MSGPFSRTSVASARSAPAFANQPRASTPLWSMVDIDRPSLAESRVNDGPGDIRQSLDVIRGHDDDVLAKRDSQQRGVDLRCGATPVSNLGEHDQEIDIAVGARLATSL